MLFLLDNGHGTRKYTKGKRSPIFAGIPRIYEGEYVREVVKELSQRASAENLSHRIITPEVRDIPLMQRVERANYIAQDYPQDQVLLISVHLNAAKSSAASGWEVWTSRGQTKSDFYATIFWQKAKELLPLGAEMRGDHSDGDPDWESNFTILRRSKCPAILTENLFMTNREDCKYLNSSEGFDTIVRLHLEAMKELNNRQKSCTWE